MNIPTSYFDFKIEIRDYIYRRYNKNFIYNSYIKKDKIYYIVNIYGDKSIQYDKNIIPYWVTLNVIINKNISDKYVCNGVQSVDINIGVKLNANSSHAKHSFYTISKWGYIKFGASKFNTPIGQNLIKIFRSYI